MRLFGYYELRGVEKKQSSRGNEYFIFHLEDEQGRPCSPIAQGGYNVNGLSKGDKLKIEFDVQLGKYPRATIVSHEVLK